MISEVQCPHCRMAQIYDTDMLEEDVVCSYCGRVVLSRRAQLQRMEPGLEARFEGKEDLPVPEFRYVGFWPRVVATIVDGLVTTIVSCGCVSVLIVMLSLFRCRDIEFVSYLCPLIAVIIGWLYSALMESCPCQATLGKMVIRAKVVDGMGRRMGFGQATGRFFAKYLSALILCVGYVMAAFDERKRGLHDMIASTYVVSA